MEGYLSGKYKNCSLMGGLKMEGIIKWRGLKLQGLLYITYI